MLFCFRGSRVFLFCSRSKAKLVILGCFLKAREHMKAFANKKARDRLQHVAHGTERSRTGTGQEEYERMDNGHLWRL